jgi:hypothetical protein
MNGLELFLLGRRLMKPGEDAIPPSGFQRLAASVRPVLVELEPGGLEPGGLEPGGLEPGGAASE